MVNYNDISSFEMLKMMKNYIFNWMNSTALPKFLSICLC